MKGKPIRNYKSPHELGKNVWEVRKKDGALIDSYRSKAVAIEEKNRLEKVYFEELKLIRKW